MSLRHLRAPREDGAILAEPSLQEVGRLLEENRAGFKGLQGSLLGRGWEDLRLAARREARRGAIAYLAKHSEPAPAIEGDSFILAGHQPELFHPGVWVKSFALNGLAARHDAVPLNLIVDSDTIKSTSLHVPGARLEEMALPRPTAVPFDHFTAEDSWEERKVSDWSLFRTFADRAQEELGRWELQPLLSAFWPEVIRQAESRQLLGDSFAAARRVWERSWGCANLELPLSQVCQGEAFAWFACHLLVHLQQFHGLYNQAVQDYRRREGIRSRAHPVPDLVRDGEWLEAPFWGWRADQTHRGRIFACQRGDRLELRCGSSSWPSVPHSAAQPSRTIAAWKELEPAGFKIRSRALLTTLYARLFLGDLFIHGIGGGKYDELTDELIRRFYRAPPPRYLILSGTRLLPLPTAPATERDTQQLAHRLHDLYWNPQRHLGEDVPGRVQTLEAEKDHWIRKMPASRAERRQRAFKLREITAQLRPHVAAKRSHLRESLEQARRALAINEVLQRRDYAFCLYPEQVLRPFCTQLL